MPTARRPRKALGWQYGITTTALSSAHHPPLSKGSGLPTSNHNSAQRPLVQRGVGISQRSTPQLEKEHGLQSVQEDGSLIVHHPITAVTAPPSPRESAGFRVWKKKKPLAPPINKSRITTSSS
mmetsp:Transcript_11538/g.17784  ORF Transcript_11538/g.17784 Transcript_11538/m.17784 type:complete len:123 (-) Transcript_11538:134-502(-)